MIEIKTTMVTINKPENQQDDYSSFLNRYMVTVHSRTEKIAIVVFGISLHLP